MRELAPSKSKTRLKMIEVACNFCGSQNRQPVTTGMDYEYEVSDEVFQITKCRDCGLVYMNPRPDVSELPVLYPPHYAPYNVEADFDACTRNSLYYKYVYWLIGTGIGYWFDRLLPDRKTISALDIGCADGHSLNCMKLAKTKVVETFGVDISQKAVDRAKENGHTAYVGRFEDIDLPHATFDVVYAGHVLEHVEDPLAFAAKAYDVLKPGGVFLLFTPNIGSIDAKIFRDRRWGPYCFPRHWYLFDRKSMKQLAAKVGFEVVAIQDFPTGSTWLYTMHSVFKSSPSLSHLADKWFPLAGSMKVNPFNIASNVVFTMLDLLILIFTWQTSNMGVALRKPR